MTQYLPPPLLEKFLLNPPPYTPLEPLTLASLDNYTHLNIRYKCDYNECNKLFSTKFYLNQHTKFMHLNRLKFKCDFESCGKCFVRNSDLLRHKRIHSEEKSFD